MKIEKQYSKRYGKIMYAYDIVINHKRYGRKFIYDTKAEAELACAALRIALRDNKEGHESLPTITLGDLSKMAESKKCGERRLRVFDKFVATRGADVELISLTRSDWEPFADSIAHLKGSSINRYFTFVSGILSSAPKWFPDLEGWRPPQAPWRKDEFGNFARQRMFSKQEIASLFDACLAKKQPQERLMSMANRQEMRDFMRLMILTGARVGELLNLKPANINWDFKTMRIYSLKGGGSLRTVPLTDSALQILEERKNRPKFFSFYPCVIQRTCSRIAEISGIQYGDRVEGGWVLYDFRHAAATAMESNGVPYSAVSAILGHKRRDQTATYTGASLDLLWQAVRKLETYLKEIEVIHLQNSVSHEYFCQDSVNSMEKIRQKAVNL